MPDRWWQFCVCLLDLNYNADVAKVKLYHFYFLVQLGMVKAVAFLTSYLQETVLVDPLHVAKDY